jgi:diguanylate cyclase (GGDEF)-like protein
MTPVPAHTDTASTTILVVDDERAICDLMKDTLEKWEYSVRTACGGSEALRKIEEVKHDIVILDVRMPDVGGEDVLRNILEKSPETQVMMITGYGSIEDAVKFMGLGAVDYVVKPIILDELRLKVERLLNENRTRKLSITDAKTGLFNHYYMNERLEEEMFRARRYSRPLTVMMIDVDKFKAYNDTYGHVMGDKALKQLGQNFDSVFRESDIIARFGGEEFVVILTETDLMSAKLVGERLRKHVETIAFPGGEDGISGHITISIGIAQLDMEQEAGKEEANQLIGRADQALYRAKEAGRNKVET